MSHTLVVSGFFFFFQMLPTMCLNIDTILVSQHLTGEEKALRELFTFPRFEIYYIPQTTKSFKGFFFQHEI